MTRAQRTLLDTLKRLTVDNVAPSYEELRTELGFASRSTVHRLIHLLERDGHIIVVSRGGAGARGTYIIVDDLAYTPAALATLSDDTLKGLIAHASGLLSHRQGAADVDAMLGRVSDRLCGRPRAQA